MEEEMTKLTIRVGVKLLEEFDKAISGKDTNRSREIRECMRKYIKQQQEVGMKKE